MLRLWLSLSIVVLLAACSSAPQTAARKGGASHASGRAYETRPPGFPDFIDHSVGREEISIQAMGLVGIPYRWGGNTPDSGFDCSGLVRYVLARSADVDLPRTTAEMSSRGESIAPDQIAAGDLVFFNTTGRPHSHVGIYVGKLRFVNAPSTGGTVRLDYLTNPYWAKRFDGIRRAAPARRAPTLFDAPRWEASAPATPAVGMAAVGMAAAPATAARAAPLESAARDISSASTSVTVSRPPEAAPGRFAATAPSVMPTSATPPSATPTAPPLAAAPPPDAFEPPPPAMGAAQRQAFAAGALSPSVEPRAVSAATTNPAPDPIAAAADAFEPPPPPAVAARQAEQAQPVPAMRAPASPDMPQPPASGAAPVLRASTSPAVAPAPARSGDDPIARFANGGF